MKPFLTQISVLLVVLFSGHSLAADGVTVTPELSASADQIAAAETRIRAFINTQDVTQDELRAVVENAATGVVSRIGETATNELRNLVTGYQNLRRELTDGDGVSSAELLETFYGASRPAASGSGKRPGEEETPEERRAREAAERRAAQRAAADREAIRVLEREQDRQQIAQQLAAAQQGGQGGKGKGSSGQDSSGNSNQNFPQPQPQNNNNDNFANQSNNGFDRLANRLGNLGNQGFGNFSSSQNSSKKEEEKKSSFSLPESKKSFSEDFAFQTKPKSTPTLPALQTGDQSFPGKAQAMELQGTPLQPAPPYNPASNIVSNGFKPSGGFGATGGNA
ncbi:hypothetical protein EBT16_08245, partial [bacterium]|nr:hypothetical protein [bacterium]